MRLLFKAEPLSPTALRDFFRAIAEELLGRPVAWKGVRTELPDPNPGPTSPESRGRIPVDESEATVQPSSSRGYPGSAVGFPEASGERLGPPRCFEATWTGDGVTFQHHVVPGDGNPRDGYGYRVEATLTVPGASVRMEAAGPDPGRLDLRVQGRIQDLPRLRASAALCAFVDETGHPDIAVENVREAEAAGELALARTLAEEALAHPGQAVNRPALVEWLARNTGEDRRLREAPALVEAWREAGSDLEVVTTTLARLLPFDADRWPGAPWLDSEVWPFGRGASSSRWMRAEVPRGHVPASFAEEVSIALTGLRTGEDWSPVLAESLGSKAIGWTGVVTRQAVWGNRRMPVVRVDVVARRHPARGELRRGDPRGRMWTWIAGPEAGDLVVVVRGGGPGEAQTAAWCVVGGAWVSEVEAAMVRLATWRWVECAGPEALLAPR
jgi:hypothetical protein